MAQPAMTETEGIEDLDPMKHGMGCRELDPKDTGKDNSEPASLSNKPK